jgi:hypothetical protein
MKRSYWRSEFSPLISSEPQVLKRRSIEKTERKRGIKSIEKGRKRERKLQESLQIKGEVNILRGEKHFNFKNSMIPFSPPPSYHFENLFHIIEKIFLTLFAPSFSLAIYMTSCTLFLYPWAPHI